jgi:hypothetical protein
LAGLQQFFVCLFDPFKFSLHYTSFVGTKHQIKRVFCTKKIHPNHLPRTIGLIAVAIIGLNKPFVATIFAFIEANMVLHLTFRCSLVNRNAISKPA